jgi:hypothetical protein
MGIDRTIVLDGRPAPTWVMIREVLASHGRAPQLRMVDQMPAFPDETPDEPWTEIRLTLGNGMLTLRRQSPGLSVIVWGNADSALLADADALATACEHASRLP